MPYLVIVITIFKEMKLCLTVLIGLPGSGKTTFAQTVKNDFRYHNDKCYDFIHVCYDDLIPVINFEEYETKWKELRMDILNQIDSVILSIKSNNFNNIPIYFKHQINSISPDSVIVIIIDDNMYLRSMRYDYFKIARQYNISFCQVYLKCFIEQAIDRNLSRSSKELVPVNVICEMSKKMEEPRPDNKWEKYSLVMNANNGLLYKNYFNLLNEVLDKPEFSVYSESLLNKEKSINICMTNVLHQSDIALRQIINAEIQKFLICHSKSDVSFKKFLSELSLKKSQILSNIKSGAINLPGNVLDEINQIKNGEKLQLKIFIKDLFKQ